jgi:hypothetical protein
VQATGFPIEMPAFALGLVPAQLSAAAPEGPS